MELTVLGVAHSGDQQASEVVSAFLDLVRLLSDPSFIQPVSQACSEGELFRLPIAMFEHYVNCSWAGDASVVETVLRLARWEPWCAASSSDELGQLVGTVGSFIGPGRDIRRYRGVRDIGEYWLIRSEGAPRTRSTYPVVEPVLATEVFMPEHTVNPSLEGQAARLLMWLLVQCDGDITRWVNLREYRADTEMSKARLSGVLELCERHQTLEFEQTREGPTARISPSGVSRAEALHRAAASRPVRFDFAISALVTAAMEGYPACVVDLRTFRRSSLSNFNGEPLSVVEVIMAAKYLEEKKVVTPEDDSGTVLRLTSLGIDCGLTEPINVRIFMTAQPGFSIGAVNNYGGNNQIGTGNTMNIGAEPQQLVAFAQAVLESAHALDLPDHERTRLVHQAQELADAASDPTPQPGRLRQLTQNLRAALSQGAADAVAQGLLGLLPGGF
ncbi:hypothetical protein [Streptomyces sp. LN699]|uniref:hypothetical protein n=1 Tax=Streptomyces sp. LN699 TaxID=3112981 RepID=UPI003724C34B